MARLDLLPGRPATRRTPPPRHLRGAESAFRRSAHRPARRCRLSPLAHEHVNMLGRYAFTLPEPVVRGELRPPRNPVALVDKDT
ncbi:hypothetical protein D3869_16950 (plasmid) [Azospirillum brasilense]|uniref:Tn3 transposase DDE domain-containing protein n=1 Tax=Azospirillum brasilense TaxID=192 RepID=A0A4D8R682_AZOBR|nr:hypothetical protein D3869_16950 [Azospirillum brasilense]